VKAVVGTQLGAYQGYGACQGEAVGCHLPGVTGAGPGPHLAVATLTVVLGSTAPVHWMHPKCSLQNPSTMSKVQPSAIKLLCIIKY